MPITDTFFVNTALGPLTNRSMILLDDDVHAPHESQIVPGYDTPSIITVTFSP